METVLRLLSIFNDIPKGLEIVFLEEDVQFKSSGKFDSHRMGPDLPFHILPSRTLLAIGLDQNVDKLTLASDGRKDIPIRSFAYDGQCAGHGILLLPIIITGADADLHEHATITEVSTCITQRHHMDQTWCLACIIYQH